MASDPDDFLDGEVPEMTDAQLSEMRPARKVMTADEFAAVTGRGRPRAAKPKVPVTLRLNPDDALALRAGGKGWQTRLSKFISVSLRSSRTAALLLAEGGAEDVRIKKPKAERPDYGPMAAGAKYKDKSVKVASGAKQGRKQA